MSTGAFWASCSVIDFAGFIWFSFRLCLVADSAYGCGAFYALMKSPSQTGPGLKAFPNSRISYSRLIILTLTAYDRAVEDGDAPAAVLSV